MGQCCVKDSSHDDDREFDDFREDGAGVKQTGQGGVGKVQPKMSKYAADAIYPPTPEVEITPPPQESSPVRLQGEYSATDQVAQSPELSDAEKALRDKLKKEEEAKVEKKVENKSPTAKPSSAPPKLSEEVVAAAEEKEPEREPTPPPPKRMTQKEMEQKEEDDRNAADRKRKEELIAAGEVQVAKKYEWNNDDLEVADDAIEITMDGEDIIVEMADDDVAMPASPPTQPAQDDNNYPNTDWFDKHNATPPSQVLFYHIRDTLTVTMRPYIKDKTTLSFTPPSLLCYQADKHQVTLDLLHDGCKDPRLLSPSIPVSAAASDTDLRKKAPEIVKELSERLEVNSSYSIEIKQILPMGLETCTCVVTFVGPVGRLDDIEALQTMASSLLELMKEGNVYGGIKMQMIASEMSPSVSVRLTKPTNARWSSLIKPPPGDGTAARLSPPIWLTPDDVDSSGDEDDDDD